MGDGYSLNSSRTSDEENSRDELRSIFHGRQKGWKCHRNRNACVWRNRIPAAKTQTQNFAVSKKAERDTKHCAKGDSLLQKEKRLFKGRNRSHQDHFADRGYFSCHINLVYALVPISKLMIIAAAKIAR